MLGESVIGSVEKIYIMFIWMWDDPAYKMTSLHTFQENTHSIHVWLYVWL